MELKRMIQFIRAGYVLVIPDMLPKVTDELLIALAATRPTNEHIRIEGEGTFRSEASNAAVAQMIGDGCTLILPPIWYGNPADWSEDRRLEVVEEVPKGLQKEFTDCRWLNPPTLTIDGNFESHNRDFDAQPNDSIVQMHQSDEDFDTDYTGWGAVLDKIKRACKHCARCDVSKGCCYKNGEDWPHFPKDLDSANEVCNLYEETRDKKRDQRGGFLTNLDDEEKEE